VIARVLPVGAFVHLFRELLEADPFYADLWLEGEVSDVSRSSAGHWYFNLRDDDGSLKCVLFRGQALRQTQMPTLGAQIAVHGGLSVYPRSGSVQIIVDHVQPAGLGAAFLELEYLRQRLDAEGLFDPLRKRPLPAWPRVIGVVTSPHGAAWQDIQAVIARRFPLAHLILSPASVQGDAAPLSIVGALQSLQEDVQEDDRVEVIILARGGGANDDLSAFNDERVVRAVFACRAPVVSGIGHATDATLVELVTDVCAPTPSAAAEMCVPSVAELTSRLREMQARLAWAASVQFTDAASSARVIERHLSAARPRDTIATASDRIGGLARRLHRGAGKELIDCHQRVAGYGAMLDILDPNAVLQRGYATLHHATDGEPIFDVATVLRGEELVAVLSNGSLSATVEDLRVRQLRSLDAAASR
jgi:exodeoxyribonuclease VII large subunit